jgi:hypothetical protein
MTGMAWMSRTLGIPGLALAFLLGLDPGRAALGCPPSKPTAGPGVADPFRAPAPQATALNAAAKVLYRQGKWEEARTEYRAAEAADPTFLAPRLNLACSYVRQERFEEAVTEVRALIARAYVPWSREVLEAADLGALKLQPQMAELERALATGAAAWGAGLDESVIFVGRLRAPLHVPPDGAGEFILNPHQEVFAFTPSTGLYRQLTAEDGHVVAAAVAPDRRRIVYVTAGKLLRGAKPDAVALDGVAVCGLTLATMTTDPAIPIAGAVRRLEITGMPHGFAYRVEGERTNGRFVVGATGTLVPLGGAKPSALLPGVPLAILTASGAMPAASVAVPGSCPVVARDRKSVGGGRAVDLAAKGQAPRTIGGPFGAGLSGLPLP